MKQNNKTIQEPTLKEISLEWFSGLKQIRKSSTLVKYSNILDSHIIPFLGDKCLKDIHNIDIVEFNEELLFNKNLSQKTTSDIISLLKSIRKYAIYHDHKVGFNSEMLKFSKSNHNIRVLSFSEEQVLLKYLKENMNLTCLGIMICLFTGIRLGELCALTWCDVSLSDKELHIKRTMQRLKNLEKKSNAKTYICIGKPKSNYSFRTIPIPDILTNYMHDAYTSDAYILTGSRTKYIEPRTMEYRLNSILKKTGIEKANFHALRHTYATRCVEAGVDIKALSEILGHANVNITLNRYVHPSMTYKHESINKLTKMFSS